MILILSNIDEVLIVHVDVSKCIRISMELFYMAQL